MNCQTARQDLELFRPGDDLAVVSSETERHVRNCLDCQDAIRTRQEFDDLAGRICRDLPVPPGLKDRLLNSLAAASARTVTEPAGPAAVDNVGADVAVAATVVPQSGTTRTTTKPRWSTRLSRRRVLQSVAVACVFAITGIWFFKPAAPPTIKLEDAILSAIGAGPASGGMVNFQVFRNGVAVKKPDSMDTSDIITAPQQLGEEDIAVYFFTIRNSSGSAFEGKLIVIPEASMIDPPTATSFLGEPNHYYGDYCTTAWVEGPRVYVCCVTGGDRILLKLRRHQSV